MLYLRMSFQNDEGSLLQLAANGLELTPYILGSVVFGFVTRDIEEFVEVVERILEDTWRLRISQVENL